MAAKQQTIDLALEHRQAGLEKFFADMAAKSQEFDAVTRHFTSSFEESFNKAQVRAQEISAALSVATKGTASSVASQFDVIRENAGKEREKTAQALQTTYEQANAQLAEVMGKTAERFRQSVAEVKQMASEVQRQLDATRQELRRGVFELPEETTEATSAMRRVVSDQIKALKELTAVVTASGADFDVAEPAEPARLESARAFATSRLADSSRDDDERLLIAAPAAAEPARSAAQPPRARARPSAPPSRRRRRLRSPSATNPVGCRTFLRPPRATRRRRRRTARANEALEGISLDIAKFVDAEAAAEMWDRWRSGDTTAVSRRLYTAQGQQTFDEIRRRYRNDPQFQASVTRYTQEFERLLAEDRPERPGRRAVARDAAVRRRQGLHDAGARLGSAGMSF